MIEFIILEYNLEYIKKYKDIIDKVMINYDNKYKVTVLDKLTNETKYILINDSYKIYIISNDNYLNTVKNIREDDWQSLIIIISKKEKIKDNYYILDYIEKNIEQTLYRDIQISLKIYEQRPNTLKYYYKKVYYSIDYQKIIYIEKEKDNKRCIINTIDNKYYIQGNLNQVEKKLDKRFLKCNRSYIINKEQMSSYNTKDNIITFKNEIKLDEISRDKRKNIINYFRNIEE